MASSDTDDSASELLAIVWVLLTVSALIIIARLYTRAAVVKNVALDDHIMIFAWFFGLLFNTFISLSCHWGLGRHFWTLDPLHQVNAMHWNFTAQPFGILAGMIGRISFTVSLLRIIGPVDRFKKMVLLFLIIFQILVNISTIILIFVQCGKDINAIWDPALIKTAGAKCWSPDIQTYYGFFQSSVNAATDLALTVLPLLVLWSTQLKTAIKVTLGFLLGLSILAMAATVVKTYQLKNISARNDFTRNIVGLYIWTAVEFNVVFIGASISTLKPLFKGVKMFSRTSSRPVGYQLSRTGQKSSSHAHPSYKPESWSFSQLNSSKRDKGDSASEENILPPENQHRSGNGQDIKKTTVITIDRRNSNFNPTPEPVRFESVERGRAPSTEPPAAWNGSHAR